MRVLGICGGSGSGKTTLMEALIPRLRAAGQRVSVIKHAHHGFEPDTPGKDSWRHRRAGAFEVLAVSDTRMALYREFDAPQPQLDVRALLAELTPCPGQPHWVLIEGFKHAHLPKLEVWRAATGKPALYGLDAGVIALATDEPGRLPRPTDLPVFRLDAPQALAEFLLAAPQRYAFSP